MCQHFFSPIKDVEKSLKSKSLTRTWKKHVILHELYTYKYELNALYNKFKVHVI